MQKYYVLRCNGCGRWGSAQVNTIQKYHFKCKYCGKSTKLKQNSYGLAIEHHGPMVGRAAAKVCAYMNEKEGEKREKK